MFENYNLWQLIQMGGVAMYVLIVCSVVTLAVAVERYVTLLRLRAEGNVALEKVKALVSSNRLPDAGAYCSANRDAVSHVLSAGITEWGKDERLVSAAMERAVGAQTVRLERYIGILGTIGSVAVYIGLFGTVVGIMRALHDIGELAIGGGMNVAIKGVAEALICTAAGLIVAVSAVVAYNYFVRRINVLVTEMELAASEFLALAVTANNRSKRSASTAEPK